MPINVSDEDLQEAFGEVGVTINVDDVDLYHKLRELCIVHHCDAESISGKWKAFAMNKRLSIKLSTENLDMMEREHQKQKLRVKSSQVKPASNTIYNASTLQEPDDDDGDDDLLGAYSTPNSKKKSKRQHTPDMPQNKRLTNIGRSPVVPFSPTSFSPASATPSQKYSSRKNSNEVVVTFGTSSKAQWKSNRSTPCNIQPYNSASALTDSFKYMFQKMADKAHVLNDRIEEMGEVLRSHHNIGEYSHVAVPVQDAVPVCGRVSCDSNGKLNAQSVVLEGSRETSAGRHIPVDLSDLPQYSLFPGQIIAAEGVNITGNKLIAKKLYENVPLPNASCEGILQNGPLSVVLAAGPFTTSDGVNYEPLRDLMTYIHNSAPDVCILLGPFIDGKNPEIEKSFGNISYEEFFEKNIIKNIEAWSKNTSTQIVLVPSQRDVHADFVYPQPPFKLRSPETPNKRNDTWNKLPQHQNTKRIHCVSDPCTLDIDGVVIGITSTDILFHLGAEEIANNAGPFDRLSRLAKHIITQHSYYPLYPPAEDVNVDYEQLEQYARLPVTPHVLVTPSELRYFVKDIVGSCCVNPGRLAKGQVGGTYARLVIEPPQDNTTSLSGRVAAEIVRI